MAGLHAIALLLQLLALTTAIHLQQHLGVNEVLKQLQQQFVAKTEAVKSAIERVNDQLSQQKDISQKIEIVEQFLVQQREKVKEMIAISKFNLNETAWTCEAFGPLAKSNLQQQETLIKSNLTKLLQTMTTALAATPTYASTISIAQTATAHISSEKSAISTRGVDLPSNHLQVIRSTNFNAGSWALGKLSVQQYISHLRQQKDKVIHFCSLQTPFVDKHGKCRKCPAQKPYWLLSQKICVSCVQYIEPGRTCLDKEGSVLSSSFFTNYEAGQSRILLFGNQKLVDAQKNEQQLPLCPVSKPFFNSDSCINCPAGLYFSQADLTCRSCPEGQFHDPNTLTCKQQFYYSRTSSHAWSTSKRPVQDILQAISLKKSNGSYTECPETAPYSNETGCLFCQPPKHFGYDSLGCELCPKGTILDLNQHRCVAPGNLNFQTNPVNSSNLIYNGKSQQQWLNIYYQRIANTTGITDCPSGTPYFDGVACIECPRSSPYFNLNTLICQQCEGTTLYSAEHRECLSNDSSRPVQKPTFEKMAAAVFA